MTGGAAPEAGAIWLDGSFVSREGARISAFDAGFQHGMGLFETMLARGGRVMHLGRHLRRLRDSARELRLSDRLRIAPLAAAVEATLARASLGDARIRVTISGGGLNLLRDQGRPGDPTILIAAQPPTAYPAVLFERGARAVVADGRLNPLDPFAGHKTLNYWSRLAALRDAAERGLDEAIWCAVTNHLAGGSVSNLILVREGRMLTPLARGEEPPGALRSPVLPGVIRATILEQASREGLEVERRLLSIEDLLRAEEACLVNSSWGVMPLVALEGATIGEGRPGPIVRGFREAWLADAGDEPLEASDEGEVPEILDGE